MAFASPSRDPEPRVTAAAMPFASPCVRVSRLDYERQSREATAKALAQMAQLAAREKQQRGTLSPMLSATPSPSIHMWTLVSITEADSRRHIAHTALLVIIGLLVVVDTNSDILGRRLGYCASFLFGDAHYAAARDNVFRLRQSFELGETTADAVDDRGDNLLHAALRSTAGAATCKCVVVWLGHAYLCFAYTQTRVCVCVRVCGCVACDCAAWCDQIFSVAGSGSGCA